MTSKSERQRTSGPQKRSKSDFMYCRKFTLRPARNLVKEFCGMGGQDGLGGKSGQGGLRGRSLST